MTRLLLLAVAAMLAAAPPAGAASGLRFSAAVNVRVGAMPWAVAAADFNGDGRFDLATADDDSGTLSVAVGKGTGAFRRASSYQTAPQPVDVAAADLDGDGD